MGRSCFKLIGIDLRPSDPRIQKVLDTGWFPFGNYPYPAPDAYYDIIQMANHRRDHVYHIRHDLPSVSVCCVVGKNGSGKSTILDILYRILNNLAYKVVQTINPPKSSHIIYAEGVYAALYFVENDSLMRIDCQGNDLFYEALENEKWTKYRIEDLPVYRRRNLFYTIGINYGLYAFNKDEYVRSDGSDDGEWIEGIFKKNDGYLAPLTLVPFRDRGQIQLHTENELAAQRIIVMSILARSRHRYFPDRYKAVSLSYEFNPKYIDNKKRELHALFPSEILRGLKTETLLQIFEDSWAEIVRDLFNPKLSPEILNTSYFYLAYKTIKICINYSDYLEMLKRDLSGNNIQWSRKSNQDILASNAVDIIQKIIECKGDHITLKIHQCLQMLKNSSIRYADDIDLSDFVLTHHFRSYDDVMKELPPAFFSKDIYFKRVKRRRKQKYEESSWDSLKQKGFKLSTMSSGERQLLGLISYICYHIKNIQSIDLNSNYRIAYRYINVILDEAELYFHPDLQRRFISMLLESLSWARINRVRIPAINFTIVTHSPFLLTDVFTENTLYLKDGQSCEVSNQTFGGNYYEILNNNFFFENDSVGDVSARFIRRKIREKASGALDPEDESISWIGDQFVTAYLHQPKDV